MLSFITKHHVVAIHGIQCQILTWKMNINKIKNFKTQAVLGEFHLLLIFLSNRLQRIFYLGMNESKIFDSIKQQFSSGPCTVPFLWVPSSYGSIPLPLNHQIKF